MLNGFKKGVCPSDYLCHCHGLSIILIVIEVSSGFSVHNKSFEIDQEVQSLQRMQLSNDTACQLKIKIHTLLLLLTLMSWEPHHSLMSWELMLKNHIFGWPLFVPHNYSACPFWLLIWGNSEIQEAMKCHQNTTLTSCSKQSPSPQLDRTDDTDFHSHVLQTLADSPLCLLLSIRLALILHFVLHCVRK